MKPNELRSVAVGVEVTSSSRLAGSVVPRTALDLRTREQMFSLLEAHFTGATRDGFEADLSEKDSAILLHDDGGTLRGFSTLLLYRSRAAGSELAVIYSGDTIVERAWWGSPTLAKTWIRVVRELAAGAAPVDLYWLLLTSGYRTYRFLSLFFREFYPRWDSVAPPATPSMLDALARERFGSRFDRGSGIVRLERPQVLKPDLLELPSGRMLDPHIAYFLTRNPGHSRGDELACLTRLHHENLTAAGRRMVR